MFPSHKDELGLTSNVLRTQNELGITNDVLRDQNELLLTRFEVVKSNVLRRQKRVRRNL